MRKKTTTNIAFISCLSLFFYSCSLTKKVPSNEYLFVKSKFEYDKSDPDIKKKQKIINEDLSNYVKQKPAGRFIGFLPLWQWIYNWSPAKFDQTFAEYYQMDQKHHNQKSLDSLLVKNELPEYVGKSLKKERFFYNQGKPPLLLDQEQSQFSAENLNRLFHDKGYFDSKVKVDYEKNDKTRKANTVYTITLNEPSYVETYSKKIFDAHVEKDLDRFDRTAVVHEGDQYDLDKFEEERKRIVDLMKNRGYYDFNDSQEDLYFEADTTKSDKRLDVTLFIDKYIQDSLVSKDSTRQFARYRFGKINIYADQRTQNEKLGEIVKEEYDGYNIFYADKKAYRPRYFTDAFVIKPDQLYRQRQEIQTKRNIFKKDNVNLHKFDISVQDSTLNVDVYFTPKKKFDLNLFLEGYTSGYMDFAVSPGVTLTSRNLFGGGENLETTLKGTLGSVDKEFSMSDKFLNAYELSLETRLKFPYLLTPVNLDKILPKRFTAESAIRMNASTQRNVGLDRTSYGFGFDMDITSAEYQHKVSIFNTEFVSNKRRDRYYEVFKNDQTIKEDILSLYFDYDNQLEQDYRNGYITDDEMTDIVRKDESFRGSLDNGESNLYINFENMLYRKASISQNVLINSFIYQFTYNEENAFRTVKNPWFITARVELAGNFLRLLDKTFNFNRKENDLDGETGAVFGIPYSQFVKFDLDIRRKWNINATTNVASRFLIGFVQPYGNTDFTPFIRSYSAGGSNDVRGWAPLTLGPADKRRLASGKQSIEFESLKLLFNTEYRFNMTGSLEGALFLDAGNIWGVNKDREETLFKFSEFYKQFGIGSGLGLRMHLGTLAIIRFDFGYKIYDPSFAPGERWQFNNFNLLKPRLHFGINYPF